MWTSSGCCSQDPVKLGSAGVWTVGKRRISDIIGAVVVSQQRAITERRKMLMFAGTDI